ncbi:MAG: endonuclease NucS [Nanoarchaeota archaeon]
MQDKALLINKALSNLEIVIFSVNCTIRYSGRAESFLPQGDRIIIIKKDGTLLVHQPQGSSPVNYMPKGSQHRMVEKESRWWLQSSHQAKKEFMDIKLHAIHFIKTQELVDSEKIQLAGTERDMAEMIYQNPSLISGEFKPVGMEEQTKYGFIDVLGHDDNNNLVVVECKRYTGDLAAVTQLRRYVERIKKEKGLQKVKGILACPKISPNALKMLEDLGFSHKAVSPPKYLERYGKDQKKLGDY